MPEEGGRFRSPGFVGAGTLKKWGCYAAQREQAPAPQVAFRALCFFTEQHEGWPALTATFDLRTTCVAPLHPACCASTPRPLPACPSGTGCPRSAPDAPTCAPIHSF